MYIRNGSLFKMYLFSRSFLLELLAKLYFSQRSCSISTWLFPNNMQYLILAYLFISTYTYTTTLPNVRVLVIIIDCGVVKMMIKFNVTAHEGLMIRRIMFIYKDFDY